MAEAGGVTMHIPGEIWGLVIVIVLLLFSRWRRRQELYWSAC
jgi:hypothetical protein